MSPQSEWNLYLLTMATMVLVQCLFAAYFFRANSRTESVLAQAGQDAQATDNAKGAFLAAMSREIRAPLQEIHSSGSDLSGIVGEILDMSKIESGEHGGTGLGLFISKQLVELMGGGLRFRPASPGRNDFPFLRGIPFILRSVFVRGPGGQYP